MSTTTSTTDAPFPALTPTETTAAIASIECEGETSVLQLAAQLKLSPDELLDILDRPHVIAFTEAARAFMQMRKDILSSHVHITSLQNLAEVAKNRDNDVNTRLRAAIAILHGVRDGPTPSDSRPRRLSADHRQSLPRLCPPAPKPPPLAAPTIPARPKPEQPTNHRFIPAAPTVPAAPKPEQHESNRLPPPPAVPPAAPQSELPARVTSAPARLHCAAGAPRARDRHADPDSVDPQIRPAASPPPSARPP